ncbi:NADH-quinone oxidoreductase subunit M [Actinomadura craniellae]|uniref:NADH-quinone oxidoreductase subunit M n=1 Tax=Actinomadura craniellae TaxID=2231787 RepID=UPI0011BF6CA7|nr:NADH-quinone oxidoreductase subunit M [Actinomadura craniellae]
MILAIMLAVPLAGALALLVPAGRFLPGDAAVRRYGVGVSGLTLLLAMAAAVGFRPGTAGMRHEIDLAWAPAIGLRFHLGVDGVSLPLVLLTALLTFLCFVHLVRRPQAGGHARLLTALLLTLEVGMLGTFVALDLLLFFVLFEVVLIPMYAVIAIWGGPGRRRAAYKFILYTLLGSGALLVGLLLIGVNAGTLDMVELADRHGAGLSRGVQVTAFLLVGLGLAVKAPMWPLHTWLPDAHTEAPTVGSVLLAGVLLKMGTYGFVRIALPMAPEGAEVWAPGLGLLAVVGIVYGALACLAQRDLKRLIAYSSVGHMGFVLLGIATLTPVGVNAALFGNVAHGLITGLLFFLAGTVKERYGTGDLDALGGGMLARAPRLASFLTFAAVASLGLPGLAGFWGEMLALLGAYRPDPELPRTAFLIYMVVGGLGAVLTAAYFLRLLAKVTHGRPSAGLEGGPEREDAVPASPVDGDGGPGGREDEAGLPASLVNGGGGPEAREDEAGLPASPASGGGGPEAREDEAGLASSVAGGEGGPDAREDAVPASPAGGDGRPDAREGAAHFPASPAGGADVREDVAGLPSSAAGGDGGLGAREDAVPASLAGGDGGPEAPEGAARLPASPAGGAEAREGVARLPAPGADAERAEYAVWTPLVALILLVGLWPKLLLDLTAAPVRALLGGG